MSDDKPDKPPAAEPERPSPFAGRIPGREDNFISVTKLCGGQRRKPPRRYSWDK